MRPLGAAVRAEWALDPDYVTVNHGSFGATPKRVLEAQDAWRRRMEAQPTRFMCKVLPDALSEAAARLAAFLGGAADNVAFVVNATDGCNAVLRSRRFRPGDEIVLLSHAYGAVRNAVRYVCDVSGARMVAVDLPFPRVADDDAVARVAAALTSRTRLAVLDHITSQSALVLPIGRMIAACHAACVPVLVDGAHAPGHVDLNMTALNADWYVGNCHKWMMAPKGCAFLYARADRRADLHPLAISHGFGGGFRAEFDWTGTWDPSAFLAIGAAIDFCDWLGGPALRARNAALAAEAAALVAGVLRTETGGGNDVAGAMALVRLPVAGAVSEGRALRLRELVLDAGGDVPIHANAGGIWMRLSAQAYNELDDYRKLAGLLQSVLRVEAEGACRQS
jgi:isopenicillin-N epimerase